MRGEENYNRKRSSGEENLYGRNGISTSRSVGVIVLLLALLLFQIGVFVVEKISVAEEADELVAEESVSDSLQSCTAGRIAPARSGNGAKKSGKIAEKASVKRNVMPFEFDPNTISEDSLVLLGFSQKQAQSIVKYRNKGGRFRKKEDFARLYVVSEEKYNELAGYIVIKGVGKQKSTGVQQRQIGHKESADSVGKRVESVKKSIDRQRKERAPLLVNLNMADTSDLMKLYGIGRYYAEKIVTYRWRLGNFYAPEQLMEIDGIDSARYAGFSDRITADPAAVKRFSLDTAGKYFLINHPYIGAYAARGIILMREKMGPEACTLENLVKERIISEEMAQKLWYYVE